MKRIFLLLIALLSLSAVAWSQDVYIAGTGINEFGYMTAVVYRNSDQIYIQSSETMDQLGYGLVVNPYNSDDVFWEALVGSSSTAVANIYRNDALYVSLGDGSIACKLYWYDQGTDDPDQSLYFLGRQKIEGHYYVSVWRGNETVPLYSPDAGDGRESMALDIVAVPGSSGVDVYYCGARDDESHHEIATIWKNNEEFITLPESGVENFVVSMDYYNGDLYSLVFETLSDGGALKLYVNDQFQYSVIEGVAENYVSSVRVDAGNVYVYVYYDQGSTKVWRDGELIYQHDGTFGEMFEAYNLAEVTTDGVYYIALDFDASQTQGQYYVYHNETVIQTYDIHEMELITAMDVVMECKDQDARSLPYFEGFETGATDWECWTVVDEGANCNENGVYLNSYWHRQGNKDAILPFSGDYCAMYLWNDGLVQEGWLISPPIHIPSDLKTLLSFKTFERYPFELQYEGVWISTTTNNPNSFTEVWTQDQPLEEWSDVEIDLTDYQGQDVYVAFKYSGLDGHSWYIDDVNIVDTPLPPNSVEEGAWGRLAVYPNPANESIRVEGFAGEVKIYNSLGELVKEVHIDPDYEIAIGELSKGIYLLRCGEVSLRFVKE